MKVYIGAPWLRKQDAIAAGKLFEAAGHVVTSSWFHHEGDPTDTTGMSLPPDYVMEQATEDITDVLRSDALVVLNLQKSEGKAVETGIALVAGLRVISVGPRSNIFQSLGTEVDTVEEAIACLT